MSSVLALPSELSDLARDQSFIVAQFSISRDISLPHSGYNRAFNPVLQVVEAQYSLPRTQYPPNQGGMVALEMFRNSWYHGPKPTVIDIGCWYDAQFCIYGIRDGGEYFRKPATKVLWETAHRQKNDKGVPTGVVNPNSVTSHEYAGGHNIGAAVMLSSPILCVDTLQGALFVGMDGTRMNL